MHVPIEVAILEACIMDHRDIMEELDRRREMIPPMDFDLNIPPVGHDPPDVTSSPPDDWCTRYSLTEIVIAYKFEDSEPPHVEVPPIYSYHEARTLSDNWVMTSPNEPLVLPYNPLMPSTEDIASWNF
ncbi:hypothetical protein HAX54_011776 [Datura stramonium]|uniref:Uncharacterized protein n=1 Tax=Datura stramonium TaxID=4076 RepID=A0ABS8Y2W8_DATST|nr:hypothetical protein [Datura stramonium]